jgi:long-chain fatty acid transport protein
MTFRVRAIAAALGAAGAIAAGQVGAAGFQLLEQNASALGNAYSGTAASAEDATTIFFNPAGMSFLPGTSAAISVDLVRPSAKFTPINPNAFLAFPPLSGIFDSGGDAGDWAVVPAAYFSYRLNPRVDLGVSVNAPFGLKTEYTPSWVGRFQGIKSELQTIAIGASASYRITDAVSVGLGVTAQNADAELTAALNPANLAAQSKLEGDDWGYGWNIGILAAVTPSTRLGASYRSEIKHEIEGSITLSGPVFSTPATADVKLPAIFTISATHQLNDKWELLADIAWTDWSVFDRLLVRVPPSLVFPTGVAQVIPENWDDTWRFALGANYKYNEKVKFRFGVAYDETPVPDLFRTVRIPDNDRTWVAVGVRFKLTPKDALDIGYAHLFVDDASLSQPAPGTQAGPAAAIPLTGNYENNVNILGFQYSRSF